MWVLYHVLYVKDINAIIPANNYFMVRFHMWLTHVYVYQYLFPARQPCPAAGNLIKWLFLLWVFMYICTILGAVTYSFLLLITPSSLICIFSPPFSLCRPIASGLCYLFVVGATKNKVYLISSYLILSIAGTLSRNTIITMGKIDTSDLMMIMKWAIDISFQSAKLTWASWTHTTPYIVLTIKGNRLD